MSKEKEASSPIRLPGRAFQAEGTANECRDSKVEAGFVPQETRKRPVWLEPVDRSESEEGSRGQLTGDL